MKRTLAVALGMVFAASTTLAAKSCFCSSVRPGNIFTAMCGISIPFVGSECIDADRNDLEYDAGRVSDRYPTRSPGDSPVVAIKTLRAASRISPSRLMPAVAHRRSFAKSMLLPIGPLRRAIDWKLDADFSGAGISFKNIDIEDQQEERSAIS